MPGAEHVELPLLPGDQDEDPPDARPPGEIERDPIGRLALERVDRLDDDRRARLPGDPLQLAPGRRDGVGAEEPGAVADLGDRPARRGAGSCPAHGGGADRHGDAAPTANPTAIAGSLPPRTAAEPRRSRSVVPWLRSPLLVHGPSSRPILCDFNGSESTGHQGHLDLGEHPLDQLGVVVGAVPAIVADAAILGELGGVRPRLRSVATMARGG